MLIDNRFPDHIFVIGAGGTGSKLVPEIVRWLQNNHSLYRLDLSRIQVHLVDHDIVETKNLLRQNFTPFDLGKIKGQAIKDMWRDMANINVVPEAVNRDTLPLIFTDDIINNQDFAVFSCVDHQVPASQIYNYLLENSGSSNVWTWFYTGGTVKEQTINGSKRTLETTIPSPYITSYMYGMYEGIPITPVQPHKIQPFFEPVDPSTLGVSSVSGSCMMQTGTNVVQSSLMNMMAAEQLMTMFSTFYDHEVIIPTLLMDNFTWETSTPISLYEIVQPENYPEFVDFLKEQEAENATR